jgi:hypothetical protein
MSAATSRALSPVFQAATKYWEDLVNECQKQTEAINACATQHGLTGEELVEWFQGSGIRMRRSRLPSTTVQAHLDFQAWGPAICGTVTGYQNDETSFGHEEFELLIATDLDGSTIAIAGEGRSFSPAEVARYLTQNFRRCFPCISLCDPTS